MRLIRLIKILEQFYCSSNPTFYITLRFMKQVNFSIQLNGIIFLTSCFVSMIIMLSSVCISLSVMLDSATPWSAAPWTPWSMGFSRQGYWSGLPFTSPGDLPDPGIEPGSPALP